MGPQVGARRSFSWVVRMDAQVGRNEVNLPKASFFSFSFISSFLFTPIVILRGLICLFIFKSVYLICKFKFGDSNEKGKFK